MTAYTFDGSLVSDLHKDARGFRTRELWWNMWNNYSDAEKQAEWDRLIRELNDEMESQRHAEAMAMIAMHQRIQGTMLLGAKDEVQALQWIMEAESFDDYDLQYGSSYFCWKFNLPYSADKEFPIQEAINEMLAEVV